MVSVGCAASEAAAKRDPLTCERNPDCAKERDKYIDCDRQCSYDPNCSRLCREMQPDRPTR
jgi:hypothetical protein